MKTKNYEVRHKITEKAQINSLLFFCHIPAAGREESSLMKY